MYVQQRVTMIDSCHAIIKSDHVTKTSDHVDPMRIYGYRTMRVAEKQSSSTWTTDKLM